MTRALGVHGFGELRPPPLSRRAGAPAQCVGGPSTPSERPSRLPLALSQAIWSRPSGETRRFPARMLADTGRHPRQQGPHAMPRPGGGRKSLRGIRPPPDSAAGGVTFQACMRPRRVKDAQPCPRLLEREMRNRTTKRGRVYTYILWIRVDSDTQISKPATLNGHEYL